MVKKFFSSSRIGRIWPSIAVPSWTVRYKKNSCIYLKHLCVNHENIEEVFQKLITDP